MITTIFFLNKSIILSIFFKLLFIYIDFSGLKLHRKYNLKNHQIFILFEIGMSLLIYSILVLESPKVDFIY